MDHSQSPYRLGFADGLAGKPAPPFPTSGSSWSFRLYARGWSDGMSKRMDTDNG